MFGPKELDLRNTYNPNLKEIQESAERTYGEANSFYRKEELYLKDVERRIMSGELSSEKDIYDEDGFDFEIVCPYCNYEFIIDLDENKSEIECPECKNMIELDWTGNINDEKSGCQGSCHGCIGCGDENEEEDDM